MTPSNEAVEAAARAMCASDPNIRMGDAERIVQQRVNLEWREYIKLATAALTAALPMIRAQVLEEAAGVCEDQRPAYPSPQYATGLPLALFIKRVACKSCADAIRALKENRP